MPLMTAEVSNSTQGEVEGIFPKTHTEEPPPSRKTCMIIESIINGSLQESAEDWGNGHGRLQYAVAFAEFTFSRTYDQQLSEQTIRQNKLTFSVPTSKDIVKRWPVACFEKTNNKTKTKQCAIRLCTSKSEGENCPTNFKEGNPDCEQLLDGAFLTESEGSAYCEPVLESR